jgi:hypothetical protein
LRSAGGRIGYRNFVPAEQFVSQVKGRICLTMTRLIGTEPDVERTGGDSCAGHKFVLAPTDANGVAFSRTFAQVLNTVYLGRASANYGFFPQGLNGSMY